MHLRFGTFCGVAPVLNEIIEIKDVYESDHCFHCYLSSLEKIKLEPEYVGMREEKVCPRCGRFGEPVVRQILEHIFTLL